MLDFSSWHCWRRGTISLGVTMTSLVSRQDPFLKALLQIVLIFRRTFDLDLQGFGLPRLTFGLVSELELGKLKKLKMGVQQTVDIAEVRS